MVIGGYYTVHVAQASFAYLGASDMGNGMGGNMSGGMMGGGGGMMGSVDSSFVQVGSTVALGGLVEDDLFSAVFVRIMGDDMMGQGRIHSLSHDMSGNVNGFTMSSRGTMTQVVFDASTLVTNNGRMMSGNSMKTGMHAKVGGIQRQDGSVLAKTVRVKRTGGMM